MHKQDMYEILGSLPITEGIEMTGFRLLNICISGHLAATWQTYLVRGQGSMKSPVHKQWVKLHVLEIIKIFQRFRNYVNLSVLKLEKRY